MNDEIEPEAYLYDAVEYSSEGRKETKMARTAENRLDNEESEERLFSESQLCGLFDRVEEDSESVAGSVGWSESEHDAVSAILEALRRIVRNDSSNSGDSDE